MVFLRIIRRLHMGIHSFILFQDETIGWFKQRVSFLILILDSLCSRASIASFTLHAFTILKKICTLKPFGLSSSKVSS